MINLRPYQTEARYQVNTLLNAKRHPCLVMPTGAGKTKTSIKIIEDRIKLGRKVYILVPQEEIFTGWIKDLRLQCLNFGYINSEGIRGQNKDVYVCMPLSLVNILHLIPESIWPDEIITDENHHCAASSWEKIYNFFPDATRLGLTATPKRTDNKPLDHLYTDIVQTTTMKQLIKDGNLAKPLVIAPERYHLEVPIKNGDYDPKKQAELLGDIEIIGNVIDNYSHVFGGLPVLVACSTFEHARKMTEEFQKAGWQWGHIHSNLLKIDRKRMLKKISNGELNGLCTVGIGIEGMDIPGLYGLIWLRRTLSLTIYLQFNGRVLRPLPGKEHGIIIDPVGNTFIHGWPDADREWSLSGEVKEVTEEVKMKKCPSCGVMNNPENEECHFCGEPMHQEIEKKIRKLPAMVDGKLIIIHNDGEIEEIRKRYEGIKKIIAEKKEEKKKKSEQLEVIGDTKKVSIMKDNLFKNRRKLFTETLSGFM